MNPSTFLQSGFILLPILLIIFISFSVKSIKFLIYGATWLILTAYLSSLGLFSDFASTPPKIMLLLLPTLIGAVLLAFSPIGTKFKNLPLSIIIGYQSFRILVEILIHQAVSEGIAPPQISWAGLNFDIISGISAIPIALYSQKLKPRIILIWNTISLFLLLWVVLVSIVSFPSPFQLLKPDNTWISKFPFIWLPTVAVSSALFGHIVLFRKLRTRAKA